MKISLLGLKNSSGYKHEYLGSSTQNLHKSLGIITHRSVTPAPLGEGKAFLRLGGHQWDICSMERHRAWESRTPNVLLWPSPTSTYIQGFQVSPFQKIFWKEFSKYYYLNDNFLLRLASCFTGYYEHELLSRKIQYESQHPLGMAQLPVALF